MSYSLYDASVPPFIQYLSSLSNVMRKGREHYEAQNLDISQVVEKRIAVDMLDFRFQVLCTIRYSLGAIEAGETGMFAFGRPAGESYIDLQTMVANTIEKLKAYPRDHIESFMGKDVAFPRGAQAVLFVYEDFISSFSLPSFYFHHATAYNILRGSGAPIGKADYLGRMRTKLSS